jgi:hypothetical protein
MGDIRENPSEKACEQEIPMTQTHSKALQTRRRNQSRRKKLARETKEAERLQKQTAKAGSKAADDSATVNK